MLIKEIYKQFSIPSNLIDHMLAVCGVVDFLDTHWNSQESVNWIITKQAALLHDLGNIVTFDFDRYPQLLGKEFAQIVDWKAKQKEMIEKYGTDDHEVTEKMLREISVPNEVITIAIQKSFGKSIAISESNNWPLKLLHYADLRVSPIGVGSLHARLQDIHARIPSYATRSDFAQLTSACYALEREIQNHIDVPLSAITPETIQQKREFLFTDI